MELTVRRLTANEWCIIGALDIDGATECFTLELPLTFEGRANVPQKTCIPAGRYQVIKAMSPHFGQAVPHLVNVPDRTEVEIHWGNKAADIRGCILVGEQRLSDTMIGESKAAYAELMPQLELGWAGGGQVWITLVDPPSPDEVATS